MHGPFIAVFQDTYLLIRTPANGTFGTFSENVVITITEPKGI